MRKEWMVRLGLVVGTLASIAAFVPATTSADSTSFNCDASALRVQLLGQTVLEPLTANRGAAQCQNANNSLLQFPAGLPISGGVGLAQTAVDANDQNAGAEGGLASLAVGDLQQQLAPLVTATLNPVIQNVQPITIPVPSPLSLLIGTSNVTVDVRPALQSVVDSVTLPNVDLADVNAAVAYATSKCVAGQPQLAGSSQLLGLKVLGQTIPTDQAVSEGLTLLNSQSINLGSLDLSKITLPPLLNLTQLQLTTLLQTVIKPALSALPPIQIPATLLQLTTTPNQQTLLAGHLTQNALHLNLALAGQNVLDLALGEARVSAGSVNCTGVAASSPAAQQALQCTTRKLTLIDVLQHGNHVELLGAAGNQLVGKRVGIYSTWNNQLVATPVVGSDGFFHATAPLPPAGIAYTNLARYQARGGGESSLRLKLHRRLIVESIRSSGGKVKISGVVTRPLTNPPATIVIQRRVSCTQLVTIKRFTPTHAGRWTVTVTPPPNEQVGVYRAQTQVLKHVTNPKQFPTFTLPRVVEVNG